MAVYERKKMKINVRKSKEMRCVISDGHEPLRKDEWREVFGR